MATAGYCWFSHPPAYWSAPKELPYRRHKLFFGVVGEAAAPPPYRHKPAYSGYQLPPQDHGMTEQLTAGAWGVLPDKLEG
jgi:hypothetical protein